MKQHKSTHKLVATALLLALLVLCLAACNNQADSQVVPTLVPEADAAYQPAVGGVSANGTLLPARDVRLSFGVGGRIASVEVEVGQTVQAGQTLAVLDATDLQRAVAQAQLGLESAQARLAQIQATPVPEQILAATAGITSAQAALTQANAQASQRANQDTIDRYALQQATRALADAQSEYDEVLNNPATHDWAPSSPAAEALETAQDYYDVTLAQYNLNAASHSDAVAIADAEALLAQAELTLHEAQHLVTPEALTLAQLDVEHAQLALEAAQADMAQTTLVAPFDGTVSAVLVTVGEWAAPGAPVVELLDVSSWRVETKNVGELQIARVQVGQEARVQVFAFQDQELHGRIVTISPVAVVQQGDTTYTLMIELDPTDLNLRPGMNVQVEIAAD